MNRGVTRLLHVLPEVLEVVSLIFLGLTQLTLERFSSLDISISACLKVTLKNYKSRSTGEDFLTYAQNKSRFLPQLIYLKVI
jgi:hypothetical protein